MFLCGDRPENIWNDLTAREYYGKMFLVEDSSFVREWVLTRSFVLIEHFC